jgi:hypothetical protein
MVKIDTNLLPAFVMEAILWALEKVISACKNAELYRLISEHTRVLPEPTSLRSLWVQNMCFPSSNSQPCLLVRESHSRVGFKSLMQLIFYSHHGRTTAADTMQQVLEYSVQYSLKSVWFLYYFLSTTYSRVQYFLSFILTYRGFKGHTVSTLQYMYGTVHVQYCTYTVLEYSYTLSTVALGTPHDPSVNASCKTG